MNKIEQVARAISALENPLSDIDMAKLSDEEMKEFISNSLARAAIEAMRVPTEKQGWAGNSALATHVADYVTLEDLCAAYTAMIDAALEGK